MGLAYCSCIIIVEIVLLGMVQAVGSVGRFWHHLGLFTGSRQARTWAAAHS